MADRSTYSSSMQHTRVRFRPLTWGCALQCTTPESPTTQKIQLDLEVITDRSGTPCCILPKLVVNDPDGVMDTSGGNMLLLTAAYDTQFDYVRGHEWYVDGEEISSVWTEGTDYDILYDATSEENGLLSVYKNLSEGEVVSLQYRGVFTDTRTATNIVVVSDKMELTCLEAGSEELQMSAAPSIVAYDPLKDQRLLYDYLTGKGEEATYTDDGQTYLRTVEMAILQGTEALEDVPSGYGLYYYLRGTDTEITEADAFVDSIDGRNITFDMRCADDTEIEARLINGTDLTATAVETYYAASVSDEELLERADDDATNVWTFDELVSDDDGDYFEDSHGSASMVNTYGTITCVDGAAVFDGTQILKTPFTMWNGDLTVAFWIDFRDVTDVPTQTILQDRLSIGYGLSVLLYGSNIGYSDGSLRFDYGGNQFIVTAGLVAGTDYHVAFTVDWDGGTKACYINGEAVGTTTFTPASQSFASYLWMGGSAVSDSGPTSISSNPLYASVGEMRIYDSALSADDIADIYAAGEGGLPTATEWSTEVPELTESLRYLWSYYETTHSDGSVTESDPYVVGEYGETFTVPTNEATLATLQGTGLIRCRCSIDLLFQPTEIVRVRAKNGCDINPSQETYENTAVINTAKETVENAECYFDITWNTSSVGADTTQESDERTEVGRGEDLSLDVDDIGMDKTTEDGAQFWVDIAAAYRAACDYLADDEEEILTDDDGNYLIG